RRRVGHGVAHATVEVFDEFFKDLEFAREVKVESALSDARGLGDAHDGCLRVPALGEHFLCGLQQFGARARSSGGAWCESHWVPAFPPRAPRGPSRSASYSATSSRRRTLFAPERGIVERTMTRLGTL